MSDFPTISLFAALLAGAISFLWPGVLPLVRGYVSYGTRPSTSPAKPRFGRSLIRAFGSGSDAEIGANMARRIVGECSR